MSATAPSPTAPRHAVDLPRGLHTPAVARHITQRWLETADQTHRLDDAVLIVSELVTNAVRHTGRPAGSRSACRTAGWTSPSRTTAKTCPRSTGTRAARRTAAASA